MWETVSGLGLGLVPSDANVQGQKHYEVVLQPWSGGCDGDRLARSGRLGTPLDRVCGSPLGDHSFRPLGTVEKHEVVKHNGSSFGSS